VELRIRNRCWQRGVPAGSRSGDKYLPAIAMSPPTRIQ
jgi:hypothetical protein